jgi:hypothetical protein
MAILLAALPLVLLAVRSQLTVPARVALLVAVGVPVFFIGGTGAGSAANPVLIVPLGSAHPQLQVVLPLLMVCVALVSSSESQLSEPAVHVLPVGLTQVNGDLALGAVEAPLEGGLGESLRQRPGEPRGLQAPHGLRDRRA